MDLAVIILSAGKGTRMNSDLPKCLHKVTNRPMVLLAIDRAKSLNPKRLITVVGADQDDLKEAVEKEGVQTVLQEERLGTAHAVCKLMKSLKILTALF